VFWDISKAFDRVWHKGLIYKLKCISISDRLSSWLSSYLKDKRQRVILPGCRSFLNFIAAGVLVFS
jgi:hypothetical protein